MPISSDNVSVEYFRDAVEKALQNGIPAAHIAIRAGYFNDRGNGNGLHIKRLVGIKPHYSHGKPQVRQTMRYETALRLCSALDLDPVEAGL